MKRVEVERLIELVTNHATQFPAALPEVERLTRFAMEAMEKHLKPWHDHTGDGGWCDTCTLLAEWERS